MSEEKPKWTSLDVGSPPKAEDPPPSGGVTLSQAEKWLKDRLDDGVECPCCHQFAKRYRRRMNSTIARWLIAFYKAYKDEDGWVHVADAAIVLGMGPSARSGDYGKARFWGLIEEFPHNDDPKKKTTGMWRLTKRGKSFVRGKITVKSYALVFNNECKALEGDQMTIQDALGAKFNYTELMSGV
jgi:hypothetical protein